MRYLCRLMCELRDEIVVSTLPGENDAGNKELGGGHFLQHFSKLKKMNMFCR